MKSTLITDVYGNQFISRHMSWLFWRKTIDRIPRLAGAMKGSLTGSQWISAIGETECPYCHGYQELRHEDYGRIYCICYILDYKADLANRLNRYRSYAPWANLDDLKPHRGDPKSEENVSLENARRQVREWISEADSWLVITGGTGCGKTHMLRSIAHDFGSWALYLTASEFEAKVFRATRNQDLEDMLYQIERVPVLLFDDWGAEYGQEYAASHFRRIIDFRYSFANEFPTVVTSNIPATRMRAIYPRVASRLLDCRNTRLIPITAGDYRLVEA